MTEYTRPWPGTTIGDSGPYTAVNWHDVWGAICRSGIDAGRSADYNIGVFYAILNALEPTINGTDIDVDTGASLVDGLYHENDTTVSISIPTPSVNPRIDYIVVRKNYSTSTTYTPSGGGPSVGPQEARITRISGVESASPSPPVITQDTTRTTYWDIPIATIQISTGGVLSNLTDYREFVDAEKKYMFVLPIVGYDNTAASLVYPTTLSGLSLGTNNYPSIILTDPNDVKVFGRFIIPNDFIDDMNIYAVVSPTAGGNMYMYNFSYHSACGEYYDQYTDSNPAAAVSVLAPVATRQIIQCIGELPLTNVSVGDIFNIQMFRLASDVLDTVNSDIYMLGWKIEYFGWKK